MSHLVDKERDNKGGHDDKHPAHATQHVGRFVAQTSSCLIDMRHEETHNGGDEIPRQVDGGEEGDGLDSNLIGKQQLDIVDDTIMLCLLLLGSKLSTLIELALQRPCYKSHYKEGEEHHARGENLDGSLCRISTNDGMSQ